jgi:cysteine-rich repeat protein
VIETGWTCDASNPTKCHKCGNGKKEFYETCDDGNINNSDGCSSTCLIEATWTCNGGSPDLCNNCGDAKK